MKGRLNASIVGTVQGQWMHSYVVNEHAMVSSRVSPPGWHPWSLSSLLQHTVIICNPPRPTIARKRLAYVMKNTVVMVAYLPSNLGILDSIPNPASSFCHIAQPPSKNQTKVQTWKGNLSIMVGVILLCELCCWNFQNDFYQQQQQQQQQKHLRQDGD